MNLDEFAVSVIAALLVQSGLCRAGAHHGIGRLAEDGANTAGGHDESVPRKSADLHAAQVHGADTAADAVAVEHGAQELPSFVLRNAAFGFAAADLLIERVEKLLAGGGAGKGRAMVESAAEAAKVEQALRCAIEGNTHAVEQVDDPRRGIAHGLDRRLVGQEVTAVDGVVQVLQRRVALALKVLGGIDAALRTHRVRTLDGNDGKQINVTAGFGNLDNCGQAREPPAYDDDLWSCWHNLLTLSL